MLLNLDRYDITELLQRWNAGDADARNALFDRVYAPLRRTAQQASRHGETLTVPALVHETFLRLSASEGVHFRDRTHFAAVCVRAMRFVLIDRYRHRRPAEVPDALLPQIGGNTAVQALDLREALAELAERRPEQAEVLTLRYWGGLELAQIAQLLECSVSTVQRNLRKAEFFLRMRLREAQPQASS
ncbi:MAG: sigma-70 family RNA polymerase sigma factor [Rhodanobacteraceae bacterium]|nr:sigma-70 family RNA polymerase sigma factor [Rhodanobacteraceae bacterium]